jgi:hypothetical protein
MMTQEEKQHVLDEFMPKPPYEYMAGAWVGALMWAVTNDGIMAQFRAETGNNWRPAGSIIGQMIDDATGYEVDFVRQFAKWFNDNVWGDPDAEIEEDSI